MKILLEKSRSANFTLIMLWRHNSKILKSTLTSVIRRQGVWQTKHMIFHACMILFVGSTGAWLMTNSNKTPALATFFFIVLSLVLYWLNELLFIRREISGKLWKRHVVDPRRNRISIAIFIRVLELGYVVVLFFGWFLLAGNVLFKLTGSESTHKWLQSVLHIVDSAGLETNRTFHAAGGWGIFFTVTTSIAGLLFAALLVAIFMSDFAIIFGKDTEERARRLKLVTRRHRTSRLRQTRR